jgi:hypothetical protein
MPVLGAWQKGLRDHRYQEAEHTSAQHAQRHIGNKLAAHEGKDASVWHRPWTRGCDGGGRKRQTGGFRAAYTHA